MASDLLKNMLTEAFNREAFYSNYNRTFSIVEANTDELREECYKLRYEVYCIENDFEDPTRNPNQMERDTYDIDAVHFLMVHNESGKPAGTVRVVLPKEEMEMDSFPMQELCDHPILHTPGRPAKLCQISRLCMSKHFRRRDNDGSVLPAYYEQENIKGTQNGNMVYIRRRIPYAPLGLLRAAFEVAIKNRIADCVMFIESDQLRNFEKMGIAYKVLGPKIAYHGEQQPVIFNIKNVLDTMLIDNLACWEIISDMGRLHKLANGLHQNSWQDGVMDNLRWDDVHKKLS
ncbi:MAG TPA: PEP-CTERM/exosortase system-associated acyltransferase [Rhodospirillaceae bacterium]|nr:PEP-CTERM/exosortase system-associated acyltransferase [Rhodospirillaceae bacterium]